ncbi:MAG: hypothetical protein HY582_02420 [Candidatus Omnitrophica bacterium]|nr:hypothetical protein [Candidatus Omnitrophota bacterium]
MVTKHLGFRICAAMVCVAMIGSLSGCAQYKRPTLMIKVPDFYENRVNTHQLTLVADPYFEQSKIEYIFNTNLLDEGFLPIHFIAFNYGGESYDLSEAHFTLMRDDGLVYEPMTPKEVAKKVLKHTSLRMVGWGFAGLIILSIPFSLTAGIDSFRANKKIREAITKETLRIFQIGPKEVLDGFYFFRIGKNSKSTQEALKRKYQFRIEKLVQVETDQAYEFVIGLN